MSGTMDFGEGLAWMLPTESVQAIALHLPWADVLSMRQTCKYWQRCLAHMIKNIRVHIASGCCSTMTLPAHYAACTAPATADYIISNAEQCPAKILHTALGSTLQSVSSIELVLTENTTDIDLREVFWVLEQQGQLQEVSIHEIHSVYQAPIPRMYAGSLNLARLRQISKLFIWSPLTWSLADILQQIAAMTSPEPSCAASSSKQPRLHTLEIHKVADLTASLVCPSLAADVSPALLHLLTPLPGNVSPQGAFCCTLANSHSSYLTNLAAAMPGLRSLRILGCCEATTGSFKAFQHLTELHACLVPQIGMMTEDIDEAGGLLQQMPGTLQRLVLTEQELPRNEPNMPLRLGLLSGTTPMMQHLAARLTPTNHAINSTPAHPLLSLQVLHLPSSSEQLLQEIAVVGQHLTHLEINRGGIDPLSSDHQLRMSQTINLRPTTAVDSALTLMTNISALALLADTDEYVAFTMHSPAAVWAALPFLSTLRLQGALLGSHTIYSISPSANTFPVTGFAADTRHDLMFHGARLSNAGMVPLVPLLLADLPQTGLQQLELGRYQINVAMNGIEDALGAMQPEARAQDSFFCKPQQISSRSSDDSDRPGKGNAPEGQPLLPAAAAWSSQRSTCNRFAALRRLVLRQCLVKHAEDSLRPLLELLPDRLAELEVLQTFACPTDIACICDMDRFQNLQQLQLLPAADMPDSTCCLSWGMAVATLAVKASTSRALRQIRSMCIDLSRVAPCHGLDFRLLPQLLSITHLLQLRVTFLFDMARQQQEQQQQDQQQQEQQQQDEPQDAFRPCCSQRSGHDDRVGKQAESLQNLDISNSTKNIGAEIGRVMASSSSLSRLRRLHVTLVVANAHVQSAIRNCNKLVEQQLSPAEHCSLDDIRGIMMTQLPQQLPACHVMYSEQQR